MRTPAQAPLSSTPLLQAGTPPARGWRGLREGLASIGLASIWKRFRQYLDRRHTLHAVEDMDSRMLRDIGVPPSLIARLETLHDARQRSLDDLKYW